MATVTALRTVAQEERRLTEVENLAAALMLAQCSNSRTAMVAGALHSVSVAVADCIAIHMGHISHKRCAVDKARHYEMIGRMVAGAIDNHCARTATRIAEQAIDGVTQC